MTWVSAGLGGLREGFLASQSLGQAEESAVNEGTCAEGAHLQGTAYGQPG